MDMAFWQELIVLLLGGAGGGFLVNAGSLWLKTMRERREGQRQDVEVGRELRDEMQEMIVALQDRVDRLEKELDNERRLRITKELVLAKREFEIERLLSALHPHKKVLLDMGINLNDFKMQDEEDV